MSIAVVIAGPSCSCAAQARRALDGQPGVRIVAAASTRDGAAALVRAHEPDVAVVDLGLLSLCEHFLSGWGPVSRATRIVVIGHDGYEACGRRLRAQGVAAYVPASEISARLADVVRAAASPARPGPRVPSADSTAPVAVSTAAATAEESPVPIA